MELTNEHIEILKHTAKNGLFCGDSPEMQDLCKFKMMEFAGKKSFVPDPYFRLMKDGKTLLDDLLELEGYDGDEPPENCIDGNNHNYEYRGREDGVDFVECTKCKNVQIDPDWF